jgi:uncharacterized membrane protein
MTIESSKTMAGIGSILFGSIIGIILVIIGMKGISEHYKDNRIYDGLVKGAIFLIISSILSLAGISFLWTGIATIWLGIGLVSLLASIPCLIIGFILALLAIKYVKDCFHALAERSGENLFNTAGTLIWIGAILTIIGIGFFLIWIGFIIAAIGFFTLKTAPSTPSYGYTPPPPNAQSYQTASNVKSNFCPNCGTPISPEATFCAHCGKQI